LSVVLTTFTQVQHDRRRAGQGTSPWTDIRAFIDLTDAFIGKNASNWQEMGLSDNRVPMGTPESHGLSTYIKPFIIIFPSFSHLFPHEVP